MEHYVSRSYLMGPFTYRLTQGRWFIEGPDLEALLREHRAREVGGVIFIDELPRDGGIQPELTFPVTKPRRPRRHRSSVSFGPAPYDSGK